MKLCVSSGITGLSRNLILDENNIKMSNTIPVDAWTIGNQTSLMCLDTLCKIYKKENIRLYSKVEAQTFECFGKLPDSVPWASVLGDDETKQRLEIVIKRSVLFLESALDKKYIDIYIETRKLLDAICPAKIDTVLLKDYILNEKNPSLKTCLRSFEAKDQDYTARAYYSQTKTSTGRLIVSAGPSILTLPAKYRNILKSRFVNGSIMSIDFKSLEPRVALSLRNKIAANDIYTDMSQKLFNGTVDRATAKIATIAALYGISFKKFKEMSSCTDYSVLERVKEYFCVKIFEKELLVQDFKNFFGRPLDNDTMQHIRISHYIQSTSCDVVNSGFWNFLCLLADKNIDIIPLYVLHDALVIDVPPEHFSDMKAQCEKGLMTPLGNFPVTYEKF